MRREFIDPALVAVKQKAVRAEQAAADLEDQLDLARSRIRYVLRQLERLVSHQVQDETLRKLEAKLEEALWPSRVKL